MVSPGFRGVITLELVNLGTVPIALYPGTRVGQLLLHRLGEKELEKYSYGPGSKYVCPTGPEYTGLGQDEDWRLIGRVRSSEKRW